jgi:hypothetical protein
MITEEMLKRILDKAIEKAVENTRKYFEERLSWISIQWIRLVRR